MKILKLQVTYVFVAFLVGGAVGFFANEILPSGGETVKVVEEQTRPACPQECISKGGEVVQVVEEQKPPLTVVKEKLAIPISVLTNTTISNWKAAVDGSVTAKTDTTITVEKDGSKITATFFEPITKIYASTVGAPIVIVFADIKLQSLVHITLWFPTENERKAVGIPGDVEVVARDILVTKSQ